MTQTCTVIGVSQNVHRLIEVSCRHLLEAALSHERVKDPALARQVAEVIRDIRVSSEALINRDGAVDSQDICLNSMAAANNLLFMKQQLGTRCPRSDEYDIVVSITSAISDVIANISLEQRVPQKAG